MSDPAVEAVKRALGADTGGAYVGIAREALAPIGRVLDRADVEATPAVQPAGGVDRASYEYGRRKAVKDLVRKLGPLVYREDELRVTPRPTHAADDTPAPRQETYAND